MRTADEIEVLEMKVRGLERECRELRATLKDNWFPHILNTLVTAGYSPLRDETIALAWTIAAAALRQRNESQP